MAESRCRSSSSSSRTSGSRFSSGRGSGSSKRSIVPNKASDWKKDNLSEIGVYYHENSSSLHDFMGNIHEKLKNQPIYLPDICKKLSCYMTEIWTASLDFREVSRDSVRAACTEIDEADEKLKHKESHYKEELLENRDRTIFEVWKTNLLYFWVNLKRLMIRWSKAGKREAIFTHLFMLFSKICLLDPESGDTYSGCKVVRGVHVHSIPDVRFFTAPEKEQFMLVVVTEVKQYDAFRGDFNEDTFSADNIGSKILGQHGIELVVEARDSYFSPGVAGIICIGTMIVFTYLDINHNHLDKIEENKASGLKSSILYTRPYDFLDVKDRNDILETLFWFGYVQSGSHEAFTKGNI